MICVVDRRATDNSNKTLAQLQHDHAAAVEIAYQQYEREITEAWRSK